MLRIILIIFIYIVASTGHAHDVPLTFDRVRLDASATAEVANDMLVAMLYAQREGQDAAALADEVNAAVAWALGTAREDDAVEARTLGYQTQPVYQNQRLHGWRVRQSLRLESREPERLAALLGTLQARLAVESVGYEVSPERLREAEASLTVEALAAFRERAELVRRELGAAGYRLVEVDVGGGGGPVAFTRSAPVRMEMSAAVAPPALEPGTRDVTVTVNGTIELQRQ